MPRCRYTIALKGAGLDGYAEQLTTYRSEIADLGEVGPSPSQLFKWVKGAARKASGMLVEVQGLCLTAGADEAALLKAEGQQKVSDVARELIMAGLKNRSQAVNGIVIEYLEGFGGVLAALHMEAARARYYGELMASYGMDMQNLMIEGKVIKKEAKEALLARFGNASVQVAQESWLAALNYEKTPQGEAG